MPSLHSFGRPETSSIVLRITGKYGTLDTAKFHLLLGKPTGTPFADDFDKGLGTFDKIQADIASTQNRVNFMVVDGKEKGLRFTRAVFNKKEELALGMSSHFRSYPYKRNALVQMMVGQTEKPTAKPPTGLFRLTCVVTWTRSEKGTKPCHCPSSRTINSSKWGTSTTFSKVLWSNCTWSFTITTSALRIKTPSTPQYNKSSCFDLAPTGPQLLTSAKTFATGLSG